MSYVSSRNTFSFFWSISVIFPLKLKKYQTSTKPASKALPGNRTATPGNGTPTPGGKTAPPGNKAAVLRDGTATPGDKMTTPGNKRTTPADQSDTMGKPIGERPHPSPSLASSCK